MLVSRPVVGKTQLEQRTVTIGLVATVVSGQSPPYRGKGTVFLAELIVCIHTGLQRVET